MAKFPGTPIFACGLNKSFNFDPEEPTFKRPDIKPLNLAKENLNDFLIEQGSDQFNNLKFIQILKKFHLSQIETLENSEFTNEHAIKYLISVLENFNLFVFPEIESKGLDKVLQAMQRMLENYLETLDKGQTGTDYYYVVTSHFTREMKKQIEKITEKPVFFKANFEDLWLSFKRILEKTQIESKEMKKKLNETREKLKGLKEKVATISEILELTDMPKIPRTFKRAETRGNRPKSTLKAEENAGVVENSDIETLQIELLQLESQMQDSKSNPPHVLCKMLSIKSKISDLKTSRVINTNRKLSEKVRSCLTNIEKDWVINENRSISAKRSYMCNDTSRSYSPISAYSTSRSISPIIFTNDTKFSSNLGISHDYIEENEEKQLWVKKLKEKEEALDIITSLKQTQEDQLKKTISEYREKIFGLEEERNDILKLKAKVFAEVRKLKEIENSLKIRENAIRKEPKNSMYGEEDAAYLLTEKNKISQLTRKINEDFDLIYHEKIELSKVKTLLTYKHEAVKVIWPEILDLLASYKCIKP